jgi:hypothetical protein
VIRISTTADVICVCVRVCVLFCDIWQEEADVYVVGFTCQIVVCMCVCVCMCHSVQAVAPLLYIEETGGRVFSLTFCHVLIA